MIVGSVLSFKSYKLNKSILFLFQTASARQEEDEDLLNRLGKDDKKMVNQVRSRYYTYLVSLIDQSKFS